MVIEQLSSQRGNRDHEANRALAARCVNTPAIIEQVVAGLTYPDPAIIADCADVLADVAQSRPDLVTPHGDAVVPLLDHPANKVRWQAMQIVALIASRRPDLVGPLLPRLMATIEADTSVIARDKATDAIASFAGTSPDAALEATPYLLEVLTIANGRFASRALHGLRLAVSAAPELADRLLPIANEHLDHHRGVARTAAKRLLRQIEAAS